MFNKWSASEKQVDIVAIGQALRDYIRNNPDGSLLESGDRRTAVTVIHIPTSGSGEPLELQLFSLRDASGLPVQYTPGRPLADFKLPDGSFAGDVAHIALWNEGWVAQDWYRDVPRLTRLTEYLRKKVNLKIVTQPVYDRDIASQLKDVRGQIRSVVISNNPKHAKHFEGVFATLIPKVAGESVPSFTINLGMGRYGPRDRFLAEDLTDAIYDEIETNLDTFDSFIIRGKSKSTGKIVEVNLLKQRIRTDVEIPPMRGMPGIPDMERMFVALRSSYATQQEALTKSQTLAFTQGI